MLTDLYGLLWFTLVYGAVLISAIRDQVDRADHPASAEAMWIGVAVLLVCGGLGWRGLRAVGPLLATPAEQSWGVSTPLDRRSWLRPRLGLVVAATSALGAALFGAGAVGLGIGAPWWALGVGALSGAVLAARAAAMQGGRTPAHGSDALGWVLVCGGLGVALLVVVGQRLDWPLPLPGLLSPALVLGILLPFAIAYVALALRRLTRVERSTLTAGADLASATATAAVGLAPSLLTSVLEARRWRRVGSVPSRPFRFPRLGRTGALLQAEIRRLVRRPGAVALWGALVLAHYSSTVVAPEGEGVIRLVLAYLAASALANGLRTLSRSPGLERALGGNQAQARLVHLVIPTLGTALWWALTASHGGDPTGPGGDLLLVSGVVCAVYRGSTRPPMAYDGAVAETPLGLLPVGPMAQSLRGLDVLGITIALSIWMSP
ncbi:MAG: hypothetical protein AMXMBFR53_35500 [Gemmatimonadota bacterium]